MLKRLHHNAYRCRDSEETRKFYSDFLGLPLVNAFQISETKSGRATRTLHSFYQMEDGSSLAFFEAPDMPFTFKPQHDFDLHIALEVTQEDLQMMFAKGKAAGIETRGISDHGFIDSIYFRDPNGYVIELTAKREGHDEIVAAEELCDLEELTRLRAYLDQQLASNSTNGSAPSHPRLRPETGAGRCIRDTRSRTRIQSLNVGVLFARFAVIASVRSLLMSMAAFQVAM